MKKFLILISILSLALFEDAFAGNWKETVKSDSNGSVVTRTWYNNGKIAKNNSGVTIESITKDKNGRVTQIKYLNKTKKPVINTDIGVSQKKITFRSDKSILVDFFGLKGERVSDKNGCDTYFYIFTDGDKDFSKTCFSSGNNPKPILDKNGISGYFYKSFIEDDGSITKYLTFKGPDLHLVRDKDNFTGYAYTFNSNKELTHYITHRGTDEDPFALGLNNEGIASYYWYSIKTETGTMISRSTSGIGYKRVNDAEGIASYMISKSKRVSNTTSVANGISIGFHGEDLKPTIDSYGVASYIFFYDSNMILQVMYCKDLTGNLNATCPNVSDSEIVKKYTNIVEKRPPIPFFPTYKSIFE